MAARNGFKAVLPKKIPLSEKAAKKLLDYTLELTEKYSLALYAKTYETWKREPEFKVKRFKYVSHVYTNNKIYIYIDEGTAPRVIVPRRKKILRFYATVKPKTKVRTLASYAGAKSDLVWAHRTRTKGIKARQFTKRVAEETEPYMMRVFRLGLKDAVQ